MLCTCYYFGQPVTCTKCSQKKIITCRKALILLYSFLLDTTDIFKTSNIWKRYK